ncbi:MAG: sigma-70 family RNA polymerase sigma factor [Acidobacteriota bacterium]
MGLIRQADQDLVERVLKGESDAFNVLVGRWERRLFNFALRLTGNREDAFDICQDSFLKAYEQLAQLKDRSRFSHWLFRIARNFCLSHHRSESRLPKSSPNSGPDGQSDLEDLLVAHSTARIENSLAFQQHELRLIVEKALAVLPFEQRETIVLKVYEGLKFTEIAEITESPVSTVKSRLYLGLTQMKKILSGNQKEATP